MATSNPILFLTTPPAGLVLPVAGGRGGLSGYVLLSLSGPPAIVELQASGGQDWVAVSYPHTLATGESLRLIRLDQTSTLTTLHALAPEDAGAVDPPLTEFTVSMDAEGFETLTDGSATTDAEGFETVSSATASADAEGFETVTRSP